MPERFPEKIDLRAHHLQSLSQDYRYPTMSRTMRKVYMALLGYNSQHFADHVSDVMEAIIDGDIKRVRIVDGHDVICEKCPQRSERHCNVAGKRWPSIFLADVDREIAKGSDLEIGETYYSSDLIRRMRTIRNGIRGVVRRMPELLEVNSKGKDKREF